MISQQYGPKLAEYAIAALADLKDTEGTGNSTYIPSAAAYEYRSYESDTGFYAQGTGELLAEEYVKLLESVK